MRFNLALPFLFACLCVPPSPVQADEFHVATDGSDDPPWPFYYPTDGDSFVVDRGQDVELPFHGEAPELGVLEFGAALPEWDVPQP